MSVSTGAQVKGTRRIIHHEGQAAYMNNKERAWFVIYLDADSVKPMKQLHGLLMLDHKDLIQVCTYPYSPESYNNLEDIYWEKHLLEYFMNYEKDYYENDIYQEEIDIQKKYYINRFGKNFLIWYFKVPDTAVHDSDSSGYVSIKYKLFLFFTANYHVGAVCAFPESEEEFPARLKFLEDLIEKIDVYGRWISRKGVVRKIDARIHGTSVELTDSSKGISIDLPDWINVCATGKNFYWLFNLPDSANIKNAIHMFFIRKDKFRDIQAFNDYILSNREIVKYQEDSLNATEDWLSAKAFIKRGNVTYHTHLNSMASGPCFIYIQFVATEGTYDYNIKRYNEFLDRIALF
jgi:hypothetical protein